MKDRYNAREMQGKTQVNIRYMDAVHAVGVKLARNIMNHKAIGTQSIGANQRICNWLLKESAL